MAQPYATGPVDVWIRWPRTITPNAPQPVTVYSTSPNGYVISTTSIQGTPPNTSLRNAPAKFLGHGAEAPVIQIRPYWRDIHVDVTGMAPVDRMYAGEVAIVSVELSRYNEQTLAELQSRASTAGMPHARGGPGERGRNPYGRVGTMAVTEGAAPILYLRFPYAAKAAFNPGGFLQSQQGGDNSMVAGYRFFAATLDPDASTMGGADTKRHRLSWLCLPTLFNRQGKFNGNASDVYDFDMSDLASLSYD